MTLPIKKNLVPASKYSIKCPYAMTPEFIVVHNTANDASAANEIAYMIRNDNQTSFHYAIDDKEIVQGIPENRNSWNSGDGKNGDGNRKGISIEICYSKSGGERFTKAEKLAAKFIAQKLKEKKWGIDKVKKHQDFSGKYCPHRTLDMGWKRFLNMVQAELDALNKQKQTQSTTNNKQHNETYKVLKDIAGYKTAADAKNRKNKATTVKDGTYYIYKKADGMINVTSKNGTAGSWINPNDNKQSGQTSSTTSNTIKVGSIVKVKKGAKSYEGKTVSSFVYNNQYRVDELKNNRAVLDRKGICTAFNIKDLILVK